MNEILRLRLKFPESFIAGRPVQGSWAIFDLQNRLKESHPSKTLYLALPISAWDTLVADEISGYVERLDIRLLIFNQHTKQIERWIN